MIRQSIARLIGQSSPNGSLITSAERTKRYQMKSRWQKSLEAAVAAYDTPLPWQRGEIREAMIARRAFRTEHVQDHELAEARRA